MHNEIVYKDQEDVVLQVENISEDSYNIGPQNKRNLGINLVEKTQ